jgi:hypothetical protein
MLLDHGANSASIQLNLTGDECRPRGAADQIKVEFTGAESSLYRWTRRTSDERNKTMTRMKLCAAIAAVGIFGLSLARSKAGSWQRLWHRRWIFQR